MARRSNNPALEATKRAEKAAGIAGRGAGRVVMTLAGQDHMVMARDVQEFEDLGYVVKGPYQHGKPAAGAATEAAEG